MTVDQGHVDFGYFYGNVSRTIKTPGWIMSGRFLGRGGAVRWMLGTVALAALGTLPALANVVTTASWDDLKPAIYGSRIIHDGKGMVTLHAPYRADDQRTVPISASVTLTEGRKLKSVTFIVDEDPVPVAAVFHLDGKRERIAIGANLRLNGPSPVRVVVEDSQGELYMSEALVKVSGLGACASPPITDQEIASKNLGRMNFADVTELSHGAQATSVSHRARLEIQHPNNSGMQMNQITLLYIPARYIESVQISQGDTRVLDMEGSISLAENPVVEFDFRMGGTGPFEVVAKDSDGTLFQHKFEILQGF